MIVVLYSPKLDEIVLAEKTEILGETQFLIESSKDFSMAWNEFKRGHTDAEILRMDDWVFVGAL